MVVGYVLYASFYARSVENKLVYQVIGRSDAVVPPLNTKSHINVLFEI